MLHIYYGKGKGKTSTLNGSVLRAKGANLKIAYFKFLKGRQSAEDKILVNLVDKFYRVQTISKFVVFMNEKERAQTYQETMKALEYIKKIKNEYDFLIFDEIIDLVDPTVQFLNSEQLIEFLKLFKNQEVLISGHSLPKNLIEIADLITCYKSEKHYYDQGIKAREGIEY